MVPGRRQVNLFSSRKREHSRKPDEQYTIIESCSPGPYDLPRIGFDVRTRNHALAVLNEDFPARLAELCHVLGALRINAEELVRGGGGEAQLTQRLRRSLASRHWVKRNIVEGFSDLVEYGVRPTARQRGIVERSNADFITAWSHQFTSDKFGTATTHWDKLQQRIDRGVGNPCPLLLLGVPDSVVYHETN